MHEQGFITDAEYDAGRRDPAGRTRCTSQPLKQGCMAAGDVVAGSGYFCDYVTKVIVNDQAFGATQGRAHQALLYRGGLTITTTLDPRLQAIADAEVKAGIPVDDPSGVASRDRRRASPAPARSPRWRRTAIYTAAAEPGDARGRRSTSTPTTRTAASGGFAPGSTFKPFTLLEWLKQGHSLNEQVDGTDAHR